ncbi:hypothetical protein AVEN_218352-1 [Araneus ventricosus]|uniref:STPR domain-containing protein n=1 Tax=Araneus ventricosus TaxID=182803 RepID=A0A4Y2U0D7_ARAVE|nr:hypothetical protein AVEN_115570-2 [Araneus ventricosus]GBO06338.1 hypothetical protein AVEN_218352-1 [Araneus ventricosus]
MPKRKRGITGDVASRREAIRKRERRVVETEEERSRRLSTMAQHGQDRRVEETEEQRNSRLSDMAQRGQERRAEETEEQRKENTFWGEHEATFHVSNKVNKHNSRIQGSENLPAAQELERNSPKINVWGALSHDTVIGPFSFAETSVTESIYPDTLKI